MFHQGLTPERQSPGPALAAPTSLGLAEELPAGI